jgi:UDP-N-acetyl-2-amino-2-deoxyglucuronate dehydrogenase
MQNKPVKFAVIGCGHIGKRHAEMISRNEEAELVALIDIKPRETLGIEKYDVPFFNSWSSFTKARLDADVVNIATPNGLHAANALMSLNSYKHVVIEKPLATVKSDAEKIIYKALHVNRHVFSVMQNRYSPPSIWIKELVESGLLGKIYMVQLNCFWNRDERYYTGDNWHGCIDLDGGTLFTQFSHFIDIMYWLFGDIENIQSKLSCHNHHHLTDFEDSGFVTFDFLEGGTGSIAFSTSVWDRNLESSITIIAENGSVKIGGQYMDKVEYCHIKNYSMPELAATNPGNDYGAYKGSAANHNYVIANVVDVLKGRGTISTNALEGLKIVDMISRIYDSRVRGNSRNTKKKMQPQQYMVEMVA